MSTPMLLPQEVEILRKIPYTLSHRLESRLEEVVSFSGTHQNYCVGIVDMVGSTKAAAQLSKEKVTQYYSIFLNGMAMIECSEIINLKMQKHGLPPVSYRISMDFGAVMLANSVSSPCDDIFGSTVNVCSKINRLAEPNGMVIGNDMYQIVKDFDEYRFKSTSDYSLGLLQQYPVYAVLKK